MMNALYSYHIPGTYNFDKVVSFDWPKLLDYIFESTSKKFILLEHSIGAMSWEQTLREDPNKYNYSSR